MAEINYINGYEIADAKAREDIGNIKNTYVTATRLNTETTSRQNADNNLQSQISSLASGSPLVANSVSDMTDTTRTYVNTTDGHWYWYNGSNWVDGGVYQSSEDSDSVNNLEFANNETYKKSILDTTEDFPFSQYINNSGVLYNGDGNWITTDFLLVKDINYVIMELFNNPQVLNVAFYDDNKIFISGLKTSDVSQEALRELKINSSDIPSNAHYVRFCTRGNVSGYYVNIYSFKYKKEINNIEDLLQLTEETIEFSNDGYFDHTGTIAGANYNWLHTDYIEVDDIFKIDFSVRYHPLVSSVAFFDVNKNFISYLPTNKPSAYDKTGIDSYLYSDIPNNAKYLVLSTDGDTAGYWAKVYRYNKKLNITSKCKGLKYACFGDSITSEQVSGIGTLVNNLLETNLVGNFACGFATCSDWQNENHENITTITLTEPQNTGTNDNVLSNQVRRILQHTTAESEQITWHHNIDGDFSLDTSVGVGLGNTDDIPDIIYIAISINDGWNSKTNLIDDTETVLNQSYSQLTRTSIASALRWAIETLRSAYPNTQIFVASPLQTDRTQNHVDYNAVLNKRNIIKKICDFCSVKFIDSSFRSGYSKLIAHSHGDGIHPDNEYKTKIAKFVSNEINNDYVGE